MSPSKQIYRLGLVGAGRQGMAILEALVPARRDDQPLQVVGVADLNPEAPGILYAYRHNLFVTVNFVDLLQLPELGHHRQRHRSAGSLPRNSRRIVRRGCRSSVAIGPTPGKDFWDIVSNGLSFTEEYFPLKIGIVGGGRGCQKVLQQMARGLRHRQRINIIGVADPDPQASGMVLAQKLGIPTFGECRRPLGAKSRPDPRTHRGSAGAGKHHPTEDRPTPRLSTISKSRLFWELFKKEEDRLRLKVESEIKLADQRSHFQRIFDYLPDPVLVLNPDYTSRGSQPNLSQPLPKESRGGDRQTLLRGLSSVGRALRPAGHGLSSAASPRRVCDRPGFAVLCRAPTARCGMTRSPCRPCARRKPSGKG